MKTIEEQIILNEIDKMDKKITEYLEADLEVEKYENKRDFWRSVYMLVEDGYKYRELKDKNK